MSSHKQYEILCAIVASGRASQAEQQTLTAHLAECPLCRGRFRDFAQLGAQGLAVHGDNYVSPSLPPEMTSRFLERARREGIAVVAPPRLIPQWTIIPLFRWSIVFAAVLLITTSVTYVLRNRHATTPTPESAVGGSHIPTPSAPTIASTRPLGEALTPIPASTKASEDELESLRLQIVELRHELDAAKLEQGQLMSQLTVVEAENSGLRTQVQTKDTKLADVEHQLQQKDSLEADQFASALEKQNALDQLSARLSEREKEMERQRQLLMASAQARDLITARNLHIVDVHDNDRAGREKPFGRIFYTEGKSLIFYAYDLNAGNHDTRLAFHVWGGVLGDQKRVKNLGIFRNEDNAAGRWVLSFDDPHVLAQINTVFVTAEPEKNNSSEPKGKRILFAFLGDQANHP